MMAYFGGGGGGGGGDLYSCATYSGKYGNYQPQVYLSYPPEGVKLSSGST